MVFCDELGVLPGVIVNDNRRPSGRISDDERLRRSNGLLLINSLTNESTSLAFVISDFFRLRLLISFLCSLISVCNSWQSLSLSSKSAGKHR